MKRVYLDMCAIQRPLDTPNQIRIMLEAEAVLGLLTLWESDQIEIVSSDALKYETDRNPLPVRREHAEAILSKARKHFKIDDVVVQRTRHFMSIGIHDLDALHLALAEKAQADYFCTCDDRLLRRAQRIEELRVEVISPINLIRRFE
jgi:predicted nucleic acid-binding protein